MQRLVAFKRIFVLSPLSPNSLNQEKHVQSTSGDGRPKNHNDVTH